MSERIMINLNKIRLMAEWQRGAWGNRDQHLAANADSMDRLCDELEALLAEMGCASRTIESLSNKVAEAFDSMNWRGYVTNILQPNSSEDISRGRAADLIGELKKKSCEENERLREQLATELAECRRLLQFVRDSAVRDAGNPDAPYTYIWQRQWDEFEKECGRG